MEDLKKVTQGDIPARDTLKFMQEINVKFAIMEENIKSICEKLNENTEEHQQIMAKMDKFIDSSDTRYASMTFQTYATRIAGAIGLIILGAVAAAVFRLIFK